MRFLSILPIVVALTGCAAPSLYQWGGYDQALYAGYKDPTKMEEMRLKLEGHVAQIENSNRKWRQGFMLNWARCTFKPARPIKQSACMLKSELPGRKARA